MMTMNRALAIALACLWPSLALAQTAPEHQKVRALLSTIDSPVSKAQLLTASPNAEAILLNLVADPTAAPWHRDRALSSLGMFPSPRVRAALLGVFRDREGDELRRSRALLAFGAAFSDAAVPEAAGFLADASPVLRATAVQTLGRIATPKARIELRRALAAHPELEKHIQRALRE